MFSAGTRKIHYFEEALGFNEKYFLATLPSGCRLTYTFLEFKVEVNIGIKIRNGMWSREGVTLSKQEDDIALGK